jgi:hypothetical protein
VGPTRTVGGDFGRDRFAQAPVEPGFPREDRDGVGLGDRPSRSRVERERPDVVARPAGVLFKAEYGVTLFVARRSHRGIGEVFRGTRQAKLRRHSHECRHRRGFGTRGGSPE